MLTIIWSIQLYLISICPEESLSFQIWMNFWKIFEGGWGGHFRSKNLCCSFFCITIGGEFQSEKFCCKFSKISQKKSQHFSFFFQKRGEGVGVKRQFGNFLKIHPYLKSQASLIWNYNSLDPCWLWTLLFLLVFVSFHFTYLLVAWGLQYYGSFWDCRWKHLGSKGPLGTLGWLGTKHPGKRVVLLQINW